jgi:hypothetical protein
MFIPAWLLVVAAVIVALLLMWLVAFVRGRNPLPFPDLGSRIFTTPSPAAKEAVVALLAQHGVAERFQFNSAGVQRSILWDGTIINTSDQTVLAKLHHPAASLGLVAVDPLASATAAAAFLRGRGFQAEIVQDAEPELPIVFVVTDAFAGSVLNFRRHVRHLPRPTAVRT